MAIDGIGDCVWLEVSDLNIGLSSRLSPQSAHTTALPITIVGSRHGDQAPVPIRFPEPN